MRKKTQKLPTPKDLAFYRSKIETGSFIGKHQLASVFAALDAETARAEKAEALLHLVETLFGPRTTPGPERIAAWDNVARAMRDAGYDVDPV